MSFGNIVLNYGDSLVRESEVNILKSDQWLNDAIIEFYFEYLGNQATESNQNYLKFYGPAVTQLIKMLPSSNDIQCTLGDDTESIKYMFWPVNDSSSVESGISGSHWSLLVFSRPDNKFLHFDSAVGHNESASKQMYKKLSPLLASTSTLHNMESCCHQANGRDCGLHVLKNADLIKGFVIRDNVTNSPLLWKNSLLKTATPKQADELRTELLQLIKSLSKT